LVLQVACRGRDLGELAHFPQRRDFMGIVEGALAIKYAHAPDDCL
jgi:hypothetical protein